MQQYKFISVRWPDGSWTIALDREYTEQDMEELTK